MYHTLILLFLIINSICGERIDDEFLNKYQFTAGPCGKEDCGENCTIPAMPSFSSLATFPHLPDPFTMMSGDRITTKDQWTCRRAEIRAQLMNWELGPKPLKPAVVQGTVTNTMISVTAGDGKTSISFSATISLPTTGKAPYPALIGIGGDSLNTRAIQGRGIALINFNNNDIAAQDNASSRGKGKFYTLYGSNHKAGAMIAWAWGVSRLIDVLETSGTQIIDLNHIGVTGCSRNGKGALVVGAFDERIVLVIPQESGSGGSASWRISDWMGTTVQTLGEITGENVWFTASLSQFNKVATKLPFDHHMLEGMVAPRGLLVIENTGMVWLGNASCWGDSLAGRMVYQALSISDSMGITQVGNHNHCQFPSSQESDVEAFITRFLLGGTANTNIVKTDGKFPNFNENNWVDWTVPTLT